MHMYNVCMYMYMMRGKSTGIYNINILPLNILPSHIAQQCYFLFCAGQYFPILPSYIAQLF